MKDVVKFMSLILIKGYIVFHMSHKVYYSESNAAFCRPTTWTGRREESHAFERS